MMYVCPVENIVLMADDNTALFLMMSIICDDEGIKNITWIILFEKRWKSD